MSDNNNSGIRVNIHEQVFLYPTNQFDEMVFSGVDRRLDNQSIGNQIRSALDNVEMYDVMAGFFGNMMDLVYEDRIMDVAMSESLSHYKTQEKKPNVKLDIKESIVSNSLIKEKCSICISFFNIDEKITKLDCKHILHTKCIAEWVKYKSECPVCRSQIKTTDEY